VSKPQKPLLQKSLADRKRKFDKTLRDKAAALLERGNGAGSQDASGVTHRAHTVGDKMPDGTVYAGVSPDTNKPIYAMPADASLTMTFNGAKEYALGLNTQKALGHDDWRLPTKNELNVLFNERAAIGGFNVTGSYPAGWYWSAPLNNGRDAWCQRFSDGVQDYGHKVNQSSIRLVRCVR
jgi:hypothetical protein